MSTPSFSLQKNDNSKICISISYHKISYAFYIRGDRGMNLPLRVCRPRGNKDTISKLPPGFFRFLPHYQQHMTISFAQETFSQPFYKRSTFSEPVVAGQFFLQKTMDVEWLHMCHIKPGFAQDATKLLFAEAILEKWQCWTLPFVHEYLAFQSAHQPEVRHGDQYAASWFEHPVSF